MLIFCRFYMVGLNILLLNHIAHTFVISVDLEDLKKLAKNFVTDSLADKISDFVFRATQKMVDKQSAFQETESVEDKASSRALSEENELNNRKDESIQPLPGRSHFIESVERKPENPNNEAEFSKTSEEGENPLKGKSTYTNVQGYALDGYLEPKQQKKTVQNQPYSFEARYNETRMKAEEYSSDEIKVPQSEFKNLDFQQRSDPKELMKTRETTTEFDLFDTKIYKKNDKDDVSANASEKEDDVNWWEKELPNKGYDNVNVENNGGVK